MHAGVRDSQQYVGIRDSQHVGIGDSQHVGVGDSLPLEGAQHMNRTTVASWDLFQVNLRYPGTYPR